jgi:hypothetical protein
MWVFNKPPARWIQAYAKGVKKATWVFNNSPAKRDQNQCQISAAVACKTCLKRKVKIHYSKEKSAEHLDQNGIYL